ncbi:phage terminase small subunit P27 family [Allostreptomyces psammosilenae]|uniref:phage terminase small subunit P27 family n=1 Tax=Allostreptomyces psammosilenae TaxID=1892865 RepID=UPI001FE6D387|nr:phage terminase small subunit P27 family [Allostreptomyces psammosilenae]
MRKKPALQVVREGNPGKRPINPGVVVPPGDLVEPDWKQTFRGSDAENRRCREVASEEWRRIVPVLEYTAGIGDVDTATLKDYCICVARIDQCEREISKNGLLMQGERGWQKNGATTIVGQYRSQLARYIGELGLSPSARGRIQPPENGGSDDGDVFD